MLEIDWLLVRQPPNHASDSHLLLVQPRFTIPDFVHSFGDQARSIDESCAFTLAILDNLEEAIDHPDMTEELAEVLSTGTARLTYQVTTDVAIGTAIPSGIP